MPDGDDDNDPTQRPAKFHEEGGPSRRAMPTGNVYDLQTLNSYNFCLKPGLQKHATVLPLLLRFESSKDTDPCHLGFTG